MIRQNSTRALPFRGSAITLLLVALAFVVSGCLPTRANARPGTGQQPTPAAEPGTGEPVAGGRAYIDSVEVQLMESFPLQAQAIISGNLSDGCTTIEEIRQERTDDAFTLTVITARPADAMCTEALVPFSETVSLEILGLSAGDYTVTVGEQTVSFSLATDNVLSDS